MISFARLFFSWLFSRTVRSRRECSGEITRRLAARSVNDSNRRWIGLRSSVSFAGSSRRSGVCSGASGWRFRTGT
jgi:hypothetical protein